MRGLQVADITGQRFGPQEQLEVIKRLPKVGQNHYFKYLVLCHNCKNDSEMYGAGLFEQNRNDLLTGKMPCGCSKIPKYTQEQWKIKLERKARENNCELISMLPWHGQQTKLSLHCNVCGSDWNSGSANLLKDRKCPTCSWKIRGDKRAKPDQTFIDSFFKTRMFQEGTKFWRQSYHSRTWCMECPNCPDKIFISDNANLKAGKRPCDCGHGGGFDVRLPATLYVLRIAGTGRSFTGYGISNFIHRRLVGYKRELGKVGLEITESSTFETTGAEALRVENLIKDNFERNSQPIDGFRTEATYSHHYQDVCNFIEAESDKIT